MKDFKKNFDELFLFFLKNKLSIFLEPLKNNDLLNEWNHLIEIGNDGKRFRPYLLKTIYENYGGSATIDNFLISVELLHLFALIHDDIIDEANERHGVKTFQKLYFNKYISENKNNYQAKVLSDAQAILLGDLIFSYSYESFLKGLNKLSNETLKIKLQIEFQKLIEEVILGQAMDIHMSHLIPNDEIMIEMKMIYKTARYSFVRPMKLGLILSEKDNEENVKFLEKFAELIGILFQIQDDLFDITKSKEDLGKSNFNDIQTSQQTLISYYMFNLAKQEYRLEFEKYFGKLLSNIEKEIVLNLLNHSGAIKYAEEKIDIIKKKINDMLDKTDKKELWENILKIVTGRKK